ncbi:uncharacterized protein LOC119387885 isoform X1 [Rhipicephalus sanguineus]|uniref:uncharacterized protein LOC119387885 isoform X1 n=1 Tax=Rhipicephalus sanguineus TaxID=34632 RepID=UPI001894DDAE|nr:uncharacterized protein LOC119387885 isoform X1 [Rhipicephalus sanguineus]
MGAVVDRSHLRRCVICAPPFVKSWCQWHNASSLSLSTERFGAKGLTPTTMAFRWLLLLATAATAVVFIQMVLSVNEEAGTVLRDSLIRDVTTQAACTELTSNFYIWNSSWWFWPEFKNGRIFRLGKEIQQRGHCDPFYYDYATCNVKYTVLKLRYRFNVAVKDAKLEEHVQHKSPLFNIEAGYMTANVTAGPIEMTLKKDCEGDYFLPEKIDVGEITVTDVVFDNFTATWQDKIVDNKDAVFQCRLRELLAYVVHKYFKDMTSVKPVPKVARTEWTKWTTLLPRSLITL